MNKKIILLSVILISLFSFIVYSAFTSITIDSPVDYYNYSVDEAIINCTAVIDDDDLITNMSFYINTTGIGQTEYNQSNSTELYNSTTYEFNISSLGDGMFNYTCVAEDNSSNVLEAVSQVFTVDTTYPLVYIDSPRNATYNNETIDFNYSSADVNGLLEFYSNDSGANNITLSSNLSQAVWDEGSNSILFYARDSAENENTTEVNFIVDTISPSVRLDYPLQYENFSVSEITFNATPTDNLVLDKMSLWGNFDGSFKHNYTFQNPTKDTTDNITTLILEDGTYIWNVEVNDSAGNSAFNETNLTFTVDTSSPVINLYTPVDNYESVSNTVEFSYNVSDDTLTNCTLILDRNGGSHENLTVISNVTTYQTVYGLDDGIDYTWYVNCVDALAHNTSSSIRTLKIRFPTTEGSTSGGGSFGGNPYVAEEVQTKAEEAIDSITKGTAKLQDNLINNFKNNPMFWLFGITMIAISVPKNGRSLKNLKRYGNTFYLGAVLIGLTFINNISFITNILSKINSIFITIGSKFSLTGDFRLIGTLVFLFVLSNILILKKKGYFEVKES